MNFYKQLIVYIFSYNILVDSQMVPATVVTTAVAGSTPTVVIANPGNAHLSLPIGKLM
jgi:hypothetical protein